MQKGDVADTWADCAAIAKAIGFAPKTPVEEGIGHFVAWYLDFYG
jgi:UDP-glucuronate 4-epimerase